MCSPGSHQGRVSAGQYATYKGYAVPRHALLCLRRSTIVGKHNLHFDIRRFAPQELTLSKHHTLQVV
jgi:hypothetical protein